MKTPSDYLESFALARFAKAILAEIRDLHLLHRLLVFLVSTRPPVAKHFKLSPYVNGERPSDNSPKARKAHHCMPKPHAVRGLDDGGWDDDF